MNSSLLRSSLALPNILDCEDDDAKKASSLAKYYTKGVSVSKRNHMHFKVASFLVTQKLLIIVTCFSFATTLVDSVEFVLNLFEAVLKP